MPSSQLPPASTDATTDPIADPVVEFDTSVPNDPTLLGLRLYTQALHAGTVVPFALSNAIDLTVGY